MKWKFWQSLRSAVRHSDRRAEAENATPSDYRVAEVYSGLRQRMLGLKPRNFKNTATNIREVLAVLMETGVTNGVGTLVAVADGGASLYGSGGGGILGAGENPVVASVARKVVSMAHNYLSKGLATKRFPLPAQGEVQFYIVMRDRVITAVGQESEMEGDLHPFSDLFHAGHELMTVIRLESEGRCPTSA